MGLTVKGQSPWNTRTPRSALRFSTNREFRAPDGAIAAIDAYERNIRAVAKRGTG